MQTNLTKVNWNKQKNSEIEIEKPEQIETEQEKKDSEIETEKPEQSETDGEPTDIVMQMENEKENEQSDNKMDREEPNDTPTEVQPNETAVSEDLQHRTAKPENLTKEDPILKAFATVHNMEEALELLDVSDDEKPQKSIAVETKIETTDGVMNVKEIGLRKPVKKDRKFSCAFDDNCEEFFPTQGEMNKHLQSVHKATFKCRKCERTYDTANRLNKHYKKHFKFMNICSECGKGFQFPKQLTIHERKHTNS